MNVSPVSVELMVADIGAFSEAVHDLDHDAVLIGSQLFGRYSAHEMN